MRGARLHAIEPDIERNLTQRDLSLAVLAMRHHGTPRFTEYLPTQRLERRRAIRLSTREVTRHA